jgi:hypothetical protein
MVSTLELLIAKTPWVNASLILTKHVEPRFKSTESARKVRVAWLEPPALVAVTVTVVGPKELGVPVMAPVEVLNESPPGRAGMIDHEATAPPLLLGVRDTGAGAVKVNCVVLLPLGP